MRKVPDIAQAEIDRLRADGVPITDDDVVWLASLGYSVENPSGETLQSCKIEESVRMSNGVVMYPLTVQASKWLEKNEHLFSGSEAQLYAVAYAMVHGKLDNHFIDITTAASAVKAVNRWAHTLTVSQDELVTATARLLHYIAPHDPETQKSDCSETIAMLSVATGLPEEYWDKQTWVKVADTTKGAFRWAEMISGFGGGGDIEKVHSKHALKDLMLAVNEIRERVIDG